MSGISEDYLRGQRSNASVLKSMLATIRSENGCLLVFVIEGNEDLPVYEVWIRGVIQARWEPLVANGKDKLLKFREMLRRDKSGLAQCTYFILDGDYDGLQGKEPDNRTYVLPAYSVENYLVTPEVVESILRTEFRMGGMLAERNRIVESYISDLAQYLGVVRPLCELLYACVGEETGRIFVRDDYLSAVHIGVSGSCVRDDGRFAGVVAVEKGPSENGRAKAREFFDSVDLSLWIRGKFILRFFRKWLESLVDDRRSENPSLFSERMMSQDCSPTMFDMRFLASRASPPDDFREFLAKSVHDCERECKTLAA